MKHTTTSAAINLELNACKTVKTPAKDKKAIYTAILFLIPIVVAILTSI